MSTGDDWQYRWARCPASARLTASEFAMLAALPSIVDPPLRAVTCELAAGHDGDHLAFTIAACDGERWWWLYWAASHRSLFPIDVCAHTSDDGPHREECLLVHDHPGPHSFDIRAAPATTTASSTGRTGVRALRDTRGRLACRHGEAAVGLE